MKGFKASLVMGARVNFLVKGISSKMEMSQALQEIFVKLFNLLTLRGMSEESFPPPKSSRS